MKPKQVIGWIWDDDGFIKIIADYEARPSISHPNRMLLSNPRVIEVRNTNSDMFKEIGWSWNIDRIHDSFTQDVMGMCMPLFKKQTISLYKQVLKDNYESR